MFDNDKGAHELSSNNHYRHHVKRFLQYFLFTVKMSLNEFRNK